MNRTEDRSVIEMTYQLYRRVALAAAMGDAVLLGAYDTFASALAARDDDTLAVFAATSAGELMEIRHDIVGPGAHGPSTNHPVSTAVERHHDQDDNDVDELREWLQRIHPTAR